MEIVDIHIFTVYMLHVHIHAHINTHTHTIRTTLAPNMTMKGISHHRTWMGNSYKPLFPARWALVIVINGVITPYTWPFKWVTVVVTHPRRGVVTLLITTVVGAHLVGV